MNPQFQPDDGEDPSATPDSALIDPEAYDASEQEFAASLEQHSANLQPEFQAQPKDESALNATMRVAPPEPKTEEIIRKTEAPLEPASATEAAPAPPDSESPDPDFWRQEVAARLNRYRARRPPPGPRYPSLQLKFEEVEPERSAPETPPASAAWADSRIPAPAAPPWPAPAAEGTGRIIEFPRTSLLPPGPLEELAEPILARPRILDVPETPAPVPALGGILMEPEEAPPPEKRPGIEIPLQPAPLSRRLLAAGADGTLVLLAVTALGQIFYRIAGQAPPLRPLLAAMTAVAIIFWALYLYLFLVHSGSTPGLQLARLQVSRFDGTTAPRRLRRWRVLASVLSALSLGLGYAWCLLDEDGLCWHDRITRTYLAPVARNHSGSPGADPQTEE
jgi:uncharacterized RDD family membrane protein YckC